MRRALGDDARAPKYIRTAYSFGYAFCGEVVSVVSDGLPVAQLMFDGRSYPLYEGENVIDRAPDSDVFVPAPTISRRHAVITFAGGAIRIRDCESRNGTSVNGQAVGAAPVLVRAGFLADVPPMLPAPGMPPRGFTSDAAQPWMRCQTRRS